MHIGLRLGRKPSGGMAAFVRHMGSALSEIPGCRVTYLCMGEPWPVLDGEQVGFGARTQVDEYRLDARRIGQWCAGAGVDVLLCPGNQASRTDGGTIWWPLTVAPFEQLALASVAEGAAGRVRWQAVRRSLALSGRVTDAVVYSSNYTQALYGAALPVLKQKPSCVLHPTTSIPIEQREVGRSNPYLLTVSNFNRYKFATEMIEAFAGSACVDAGWHFKLAGRFPVPEYEAEVRDAIARTGMQNRIELLGEQTAAELVELYRAATAFVFASVSENAASYTVIDALAYGLPTISSFYSSTPEVLGNGVRYADPFSVSDLAENLSAVVAPDEAERLATAALQQASGFPSWKSIANGLHDFVQQSMQ